MDKPRHVTEATSILGTPLKHRLSVRALMLMSITGWARKCRTETKGVTWHCDLRPFRFSLDRMKSSCLYFQVILSVI